MVSNLTIDKWWKFHLSDYWDKQIMDLLEFGFSLDFNKNTVFFCSTEENHASSKEFSSHVET